LTQINFDTLLSLLFGAFSALPQMRGNRRALKMKRVLAVVFLSLLSTSALAGKSQFMSGNLPYVGNAEYNASTESCEILLYVGAEDTNFYGVFYQAPVGYLVSGWVVTADNTPILIKEESVTTYDRNFAKSFKIFVGEEYFEFPPDQSTYIYFELRSNKGKGRLVDYEISDAYSCAKP